MAYPEEVYRAQEMAEKITKCYKAKGVPLKIKEKGVSIHGNVFEFKLTIRKETRVDAIYKFAKDVKMYLKLALFEIEENGTSVSIIAAKEQTDDNHLLTLFRSPEYSDAIRKLGFAHPIGIDFIGNPVIMDLEKYPHMVVAGGTRSGKSTALKCLLISVLAYPSKRVNLLIGDRASDLSQFVALPHLSFPIIEDSNTLRKVLIKVQNEMKRRVSIKHTEEFKKLPAIVIVIDEFNSFISGMENREHLKQMKEVLSDILRMGRHARIHLVLAAHNPTKENMKIDTSDILVKMVFKVSKAVNSVAALGVGGAEKLKGEGDMLFSYNGEIRHLQGAFISPEDIEILLKRIQKSDFMSPKFQRGRFRKFTITAEDLEQVEDEDENVHSNASILLQNRGQVAEKKQALLFAKISLWALSQDSVSCNMISENFSVGWRRANGIIKKLNECGIVGDLDAKLPRKVLPTSVDEIPQKTMQILLDNGFSAEDVSTAIYSRD